MVKEETMDTIRSQVKSLYKMCFNDSEAFTELYFNMRFNNDVNLYIDSGNRVISALQMIPYPLTYYNIELQSAYISGACTHSDYRNKGVMQRLLGKSFARMSVRGIDISILIPAEKWLFDYYKKVGYGTAFYRSIITVEPTEPLNDHIHVERTTDFYPAAYEYFDKRMHERSCCIQHTEKDIKVILAAMRIDSGFVLIASRAAKVVGIALGYIIDDATFIEEILFNNEEVKQQLLYSASRINIGNSLKMIIHTDNKSDTTSFGMARIINAEKILKIYAKEHPAVELNIELNDKQLSSNNGYYYLYRGKCMVSDERLPGKHIQMNMTQLAEIVFENAETFMSLMMN